MHMHARKHYKKVLLLLNMAVASMFISACSKEVDTTVDTEPTVEIAIDTSESAEETVVETVETTEQQFNDLGNLDETSEVGESTVEDEASEEDVMQGGNEASYPKDSGVEILDSEKYSKKLADSNALIEQADGSYEIDATLFKDNNLSEDNYIYEIMSVNPDNGSQDISIGISVVDIKSGEEANVVLNEYNAANKAKYIIDCEEHWENVVIPFKIRYIEELDSQNKKLEPHFSIKTSGNLDITYKNENYTPKISVLYTAISTAGRDGYIVTKLPSGDYQKCKLVMTGWNTELPYEVEL